MGDLTTDGSKYICMLKGYRETHSSCPSGWVNAESTSCSKDAPRR